MSSFSAATNIEPRDQGTDERQRGWERFHYGGSGGGKLGEIITTRKLAALVYLCDLMASLAKINNGDRFTWAASSRVKSWTLFCRKRMHLFLSFLSSLLLCLDCKGVFKLLSVEGELWVAAIGGSRWICSCIVAILSSGHKGLGFRI